MEVLACICKQVAQTSNSNSSYLLLLITKYFYCVFALIKRKLKTAYTRKAISKYSIMGKRDEQQIKTITTCQGGSNLKMNL